MECGLARRTINCDVIDGIVVVKVEDLRPLLHVSSHQTLEVVQDP